MLTIETKELEISEKLKRKVEMVCRFTNTKPIYQKGSIKSIKETNIAYVRPHVITIKNNEYLIEFLKIMRIDTLLQVHYSPFLPAKASWRVVSISIRLS